MLADLAELYERLRRVEDADQLIERALQFERQLRPGTAGSRPPGPSTGTSGQGGKASPRLSGQCRSHHSRARGYELGGILDRQGRYDEAMTAFLEAKTILKRTPRCLPPICQPARPLKVVGGKLLPGHVSALVRFWPKPPPPPPAGTARRPSSFRHDAAGAGF